MATKNKISDFNQLIDVRLLTEVEQPDGNFKKDWDTSRFTTKYAFIKAISSNQGYSDGASEKDTYYLLRFEYSASRAIHISDQVLWNGRVLSPVGDCIIKDFGNKRVFEQKLKYTSQ